MISLSKPLAALLLLASVTCAQAGVFDDDEARKAILDLRAKVEALSKDFNARLGTVAESKLDKSAALDFTNQHESTLAEIARLRGQIEVLQNAVAMAEKRQKELYADLDARIKKLEPREITIEGKTVEVDPGEQRTYEAAMETFKGGDYAAAARELGDFVRRYPGSEFAANAQYWLGNAHFAAQNYKAAIAAQQEVVKNYADSPKAPDAMLNIASSYEGLNDKKNARKTLQALVSKYPESPSAATAKQRLKSLK